MNERPFHKLFTHMKREKLSAVERALLREQLLVQINQYQPTYSEFAWMRFSFYFGRVSRPLIYVTICAVVVIAGGGVSYAAEGSLPGSILYPLKVKVTEPIREKLTFSAASQAQLQAQLAEERLSEVSELAAEGRLIPEVKDALFKEVARHTAKFQENLAQADGSIDPENAAEVSSHLEASLDAHVELAEQDAKRDEAHAPKVITAVTVSAITTASTTLSSLDVLRDSARRVSQVRISAEENINARRGAVLRQKSENKLKEVSKQYKETRAFLQTRASHISPTTTATIQENLNAIQDVLDTGKAELENGSYTDSLPKILEAGRVIQGAQIMIEAAPSRKDLEKSD